MLNDPKKRLAEAHRRIGRAEHDAEESLKNVAPKSADPAGFRDAATRLSARADEHLETAERLDEET